MLNAGNWRAYSFTAIYRADADEGAGCFDCTPLEKTPRQKRGLGPTCAGADIISADCAPERARGPRIDRYLGGQAVL